MVTKTDVVRRIARCEGEGCSFTAAMVMTREVVSCRPADDLHDVWARMKVAGLKNLPVLDGSGSPIGVLHAHDILQALVAGAESDESLMQDYISGVGYR